jgi:hypothetical protein
MSSLIAIAMLVTAVTTVAHANALPVMKYGACPSGYHESGGYCTPMTPNAPPAIPKVGSCPSGWMQSGDYCIQMRRGR